jgi:arylsulfatase A-like enzyme
LGLAEDTIVIFTSDNGPQFSNAGVQNAQKRYNCGLRGFKDLVYEGGIRVPGVVRWPRRIARGVCHDLVHFTDWLATLLAAAGGDVPPELKIDGHNLLPCLCGDATAPQRTPCWQFSRYVPSAEHNAAIRSGHWKLVRPPVPEVRKVDKADGLRSRDFDAHPEAYPDGPPAPVATPAFSQPRPVELFNLAEDPGETTNVADAHPDIVQRLLAELAGWFEMVEKDRKRTVK